MIFVKDYDGTNILNNFTETVIPRSMRVSGGSHVGPSLNLVEQFETVDGQVRPLKTVAGETEPEPTDPIEELKSTDRYVVYDSPSDLFADRDPRLEGTILVPGSSFRNQELQLWAGLAIKHSETSWEFKHIAEMEDLTSPTRANTCTTADRSPAPTVRTFRSAAPIPSRSPERDSCCASTSIRRPAAR